MVVEDLAAALSALDRLTWRDLARVGLLPAGEAGCGAWVAFRSNPARWVLRLDRSQRAALDGLLVAELQRPEAPPSNRSRQMA